MVIKKHAVFRSQCQQSSTVKRSIVVLDVILFITIIYILIDSLVIIMMNSYSIILAAIAFISIFNNDFTIVHFHSIVVIAVSIIITC